MSNRKRLKRPTVTRVHERKDMEWGVYCWRNASDGRIFRDEDNNVLSIASKKLDLDKIRIITEAAAHFGQPKGEAVFLPGAVKATEEEHREQVDRMKSGLIPTMNDFGAVTDAKVAGRARGEKVGE